MAEAGLIAACGAAIGVALTYTALFAARPVLAHRFGVLLPAGGLSRYDLMILGGIVLAALCMALLPAWRAYRNTLDDGLTIRI